MAWRTWRNEKTKEWQIMRWRNGENEVMLGSYPSAELAQKMCDRLNAAENKKSPAERTFRQGR